MALSIEQQVMAYLIQCAIERRTTTYEEVAERFDLPTTWPRLSQTVSPILYRIFDWCEKKRLPKLTVLVVRKSGADMSLPGQGFWNVCSLANVGRREKILLTEMWTSDVYDYFKVVDDNFTVSEEVVAELTQANAYQACLMLVLNMTYVNSTQFEHSFEKAAERTYGPNRIRARFHSPHEVVFEYNTGEEWVRLRMGGDLVEKLIHGE